MEKIILIPFGLIFGSFLNVVIYRLPLKKSIVKPGSSCPFCQTPIRFYDNIPIISYLILLGKCRSCKAEIPWTYPFIELLTAITFFLSASYFSDNYVHLAMTILFLCILIVLACIDLQHMILPDELTLGGAIIFAIYAIFNPQISLLNALVSAISGALVFAGLFFFYLKVRKIEGMGFGDIKMMLLLGLFLGYRQLIIAVFIASISGLMVGFFYIIFKNKNMKFALPFGTFLGLGSFISLFWGDILINFISKIFVIS